MFKIALCTIAATLVVLTALLARRPVDERRERRLTIVWYAVALLFAFLTLLRIDVKIALGIIALTLVVPSALFARRPADERRERRLTAAWCALALLAVLALFRFDPKLLTTSYNAYDLVHYYLNSKYFDKLGYTKLYEAFIIADMETRDRLASLSSIRDLHTQRVMGRDTVQAVRDDPERIKSRFSPERWAAFVSDFSILDQNLPKATWERIIVDRGYNATPTWHIIGSMLASRVPVAHVKLLCHLDVLLLLGMFAAVGRTYGLRVCAIGVTWFAVGFSSTWPGPGGALLRYDWLAAAVLAACAAQRHRQALCGALIGFATLERLFPVVLLLWILLKGMHALVVERKLDRSVVRTVAGFAAVVVLLGGLTVATVGREHVMAFVHDLTIHLAPENLSEQRMGLSIALAYRGETRETALPSDMMHDRYLDTGRMNPLRNVIGLTALSLLAVSFFERRPRSSLREADNAILLGFIGFALLVTASFYYWTFRLMAVLLHAKYAARSRWDALGLGALFGFEIYSYAFDHVFYFRYGLTASLSVLVSVYALAVCIARWAAARHISAPAPPSSLSAT